MKAHIVKTVFFEAARRVIRGPGEKPCLTGYSYRVELLAGGEVHPEYGWVVDYGDLKALFEPLRVQLDHRCLDDVAGLNGDTGVENIARWIEHELNPWPEWFEGVRVSILGDGEFELELLPENPDEALPDRYAFSFAAAQQLPQLPASHPCHNLHGHTYLVEIAAEEMSALPPVLKELHAVMHDRLINEVPGLEQATCECLAGWIWRFLLDRKVTPTAIALQETPNNRCLYFGE